MEEISGVVIWSGGYHIAYVIMETSEPEMIRLDEVIIWFVNVLFPNNNMVWGFCAESLSHKLWLCYWRNC